MKSMDLEFVYFKIEKDELELGYHMTGETASLNADETRHLYEFLKIEFDQQDKDNHERLKQQHKDAQETKDR